MVFRGVNDQVIKPIKVDDHSSDFIIWRDFIITNIWPDPMVLYGIARLHSLEHST